MDGEVTYMEDLLRRYYRARQLAAADALTHFGESARFPGAVAMGTDIVEVERYIDDRVTFHMNETHGEATL